MAAVPHFLSHSEVNEPDCLSDIIPVLNDVMIWYVALHTYVMQRIRSSQTILIYNWILSDMYTVKDKRIVLTACSLHAILTAMYMYIFIIL